jgi:hypothetical protein
VPARVVDRLDLCEVCRTLFIRSFGNDSVDVDLDLAEVDVNAGDALQEVRELSAECEMRLQLLHVDRDLVDLHLADVDVDVGIVTWLATLAGARCRQSSPAAHVWPNHARSRCSRGGYFALSSFRCALSTLACPVLLDVIP